VAERRAAWRLEVMGLDASKLVFLDETWAATNMCRRYGRCPRRERLVGKTPHGHWKTTTFLAALRQQGLTAPLVIDGPVDGATFLAYVRQHLAPSLRPGETVIMGNLACHKLAGVREAIEAAGAALLYLPPYSPDLSPIELLLAKLKSLLRGAGRRSVGGLWSLLADLLDRFDPRECQAYFEHRGYHATSS
jgi:transposase